MEVLLLGLLGNIQEAQFSKGDWHQGKLCPVVFSLWGGFLNVMPRAEILTAKEYLEFLDKFQEWQYIYGKIDFDTCTIEGKIPVEWKSDSFGRWNHKIVAVDYGS